MSERLSFENNYQRCSQSRKISIGILVHSMANSETRSIKELVMQTAENGTSGKGNYAGECEEHSPPAEKHVTASSKDTSPWISTRSFNRKISSSVAIHDDEHYPNFPRKTHPRPGLSRKSSTTHFVELFPAKQVELEYAEGTQKNLIKTTHSMDTAMANCSENIAFFAQQRAAENEPVKDQNRRKETMGSETLRIKLWEILENVSSPNQHCPGSQSVDLHPVIKSEGKQSPNEKTTPISDTIESDSEMPGCALKKPLTPLTRKKDSTKEQHNIEATKSTAQKRECPKKGIFSSRGSFSGMLLHTVSDGSLHFEKNKILSMSTGADTCQGHKLENIEEKGQLENKIHSVSAAEEPIFPANKSDHHRNFNDKTRAPFLKRQTGLEKKNCIESQLNLMREQLRYDVEIVNMNDQPDNFANSSLNNKSGSTNFPLSPTFEVKSPIENFSPGSFPKSTQEKFQVQSPPENTFHTKGIQSFTKLMSSKSIKCIQHMQEEIYDSGEQPKDSPLMQTSFIMEEDRGDRMSKSYIETTDSGSLADDPYIKGSRQEEPLSPEPYLPEEICYVPNKRLRKEKGIEVTGCNPTSESLKGTKDDGGLQIYLQQNQDNGLAGAVALLAVAIDRLKMKLNSVTSRKSARILEAAAEEIVLQLQNAESQIRVDLGKVATLSKSNRKRLENGFKEQQDQLFVIYRRFKEDVDQQLRAYDSLMEDLEENKIELKGTMERQRTTQKKLVSHVERAIKVQLDNAERRVAAVHKLAREKMLQLKLLASDYVQYGAFG